MSKMYFELLDPSDVKAGDLYLNVTTRRVGGILPDDTYQFDKSGPPVSRPQKISLPCIESYEIYEVDGNGFKYRNSKGETEGEQYFGEFMGGIIKTERGDKSKLYVSKEFLDEVSQFSGGQDKE